MKPRHRGRMKRAAKIAFKIDGNLRWL